MTRTSSFRRSSHDHFEPQDVDDPQTQKRLRGILEKIDLTVFENNHKIIGQSLSGIDESHFRHLAQAASAARALWIGKAMAITENGRLPSIEQACQLGQARQAFEELSEAYEGLRRLVERGHIALKS